MIHKEGYPTLIIAAIVFGLILYFSSTNSILFIVLATLAAVVYFLLIWFFRNPSRKVVNKNNKLDIAPADGKVVVIENVM